MRISISLLPSFPRTPQELPSDLSQTGHVRASGCVVGTPGGGDRLKLVSYSRLGGGEGGFRRCHRHATSKGKGGQGRSEEGIGGHERRWEYLLC